MSLNCLNCGKLLDGATSVDGTDRQPEAGSVSVCVYCGHVMIFAEGGGFRAPTDEEITELAGLPELLKAVAVAGLAREKFIK